MYNLQCTLYNVQCTHRKSCFGDVIKQSRDKILKYDFMTLSGNIHPSFGGQRRRRFKPWWASDFPQLGKSCPVLVAHCESPLPIVCWCYLCDPWWRFWFFLLFPGARLQLSSWPSNRWLQWLQMGMMAITFLDALAKSIWYTYMKHWWSSWCQRWSRFYKLLRKWGCLSNRWQ